MRMFLLCLVALLALPLASRADEQTRRVQEALKEQGFYYGAADGQTGTETTAAIRRYQIRNGLEVNGRLTEETLRSLKATGSTTPPAITSVPRRTAPPRENTGLRTPPPATNRAIVESDRKFLDRAVPPPPSRPPAQTREVPEAESEELEPPRPRARVEFAPHSYDALFARSPFANAPASVQRRTLVQAQIHLAEEGLYRGVIDGIPGPQVEQAILAFQSDFHLPRTGRLDAMTLDEMRLLPGRGGPFAIERIYREEVPRRRAFRGIWIR